MKKALILASLLSATSALGYDCNSDCSGGGYSYPCPNWDDPGKLCHGDLPNDPACMSAKGASCDLWNGAVGYLEPRVRPLMSGQFNSHSWQVAQNNGTQGDWTLSCIAAGVAACGALGSTIAPPWSSVVSGAAGAFVSGRLCDAAHNW